MRLGTCAALLLHSLSPASLSAHDQAGGESRQEPVPTFRVLPSVEVKLDLPGQPPIVLSGIDRIKRKIVERSGGETAVAQAAARVEVARTDDRELELELTARNRTRAAGSATSTARADIAITVPSALKNLPVELVVVSEAPERTNIALRDDTGAAVEATDEAGSVYRLDSGDGTNFILGVEVSSESSTTGDEWRNTAGSANLRAAVRPGPILAMLETRLIREGHVTSAYPAVGYLLLRDKVHCTATAVGPRTLLTAAHCLFEYGDAIKAGELKFGTGPQASILATKRVVKTIEIPDDTQFSFRRTTTDDIALILFAEPLGLPAAQLQKNASVWPSTGQIKLEFVGYGRDGIDSATAGVKRTGSWHVSIAPRQVSSVDTEQSTCRGDSGGPGFLPGTDTILSVTSRADVPCTFSNNTRLDAFWPWLATRIR